MMKPEQYESLRSYRTDYRPITTPFAFRVTDHDGRGRLENEQKFHSSRPFGDIRLLVVRDESKPAMPGENSLFFEVKGDQIVLDQKEARKEWEVQPFRSERFAREHGYFPYVVDLNPLTRRDFLDSYFVEPSKEVSQQLLHLAADLAKHSQCTKRQFGSVILTDGKITSIGINATYDEKVCDPCMRSGVVSGTRVEMCTAIHAEQMTLTNAINHHARFSFSQLAVAGYDPDGSLFNNEYFYCSVCSRIMKHVNDLTGVITMTSTGPVYRHMDLRVAESYSKL